MHTLVEDSVGIPEHLAEILASPAFRGSRRSQQFLQYVVDETLAGRGDSLKERVIGEQVFGRSADYDTGQDSIVRVKANEIRKRLAQFYGLNPYQAIRFEMNSGSYAVRIHRAPPLELEPPVATPERRASSLKWVVAGLVLVALTATAAWRYTRPDAPAPFNAFWQPFFSGPQPLLICMPTPETFRIYGAERNVLLQSFRPRPLEVAPAPMPHLPKGVQIVPEPGMFVGLGDAHAMARITAMASAHGKRTDIRAATLTGFADLSAGPSVIIGAISNEWHEDLTNGQRFVVTKRDGHNVVWDRTTETAPCTKPNAWEPKSATDCGVVTRLRQSKTGRPLLIAGGLDHFGTYAIGEFLGNRAALEGALRHTPDWAGRNVQILLRVEKMRDGVGAPVVQAVHIW